MRSPSQVCLLAVPGSALRLRSSALTGLLGGAVLPTTQYQQSITLLCALNDLLHIDLASGIPCRWNSTYMYAAIHCQPSSFPLSRACLVRILDSLKRATLCHPEIAIGVVFCI